MTQSVHAFESRIAASRIRFKLFCSILTNFGYAVAGVSLIQPLFASVPEHLTPGRASGFLFGLALQGLAVYLAPRGEKP